MCVPCAKLRFVSGEPWYAVRCLFHFPWGDPPGVYEERITLWRASSADEAIRRAEAEASEYIEGSDGRYVGLAQSYHLAVGDTVDDGSEVFSLMRDSSLGSDEYISQFFDTGSEHHAVEDRGASSGS